MSLERRRPFHERVLIVVMFWVLVCFETLSNNQVILSCPSDRPDKNHGLLVSAHNFKNYTASFDGVRSEAVLSVVRSLGAPPFSVLHNDKRFSEWHAGSKKALEEEVSSNTREEWGPGSDEQKQKKQQKTRKSECVCQCRPSDRAKAGRFFTKPCRFRWTRLNAVTIPTLAPRHNRSDAGPVSSTGPGRRCRRLQCRAWNVDITPNPRGQAQRNCLSCRDKKVDLLCLTSNCPSRNGHRGVVDLLLMSERQRKGIEGSGVMNVILVSLACLALLLGDHSRQKTASLLPLLRRPAMATKWTASVEKAIKDFFRSYSPVSAVSSDRNVSRLESLGKVSKNSLENFELRVSELPCCLTRSAERDWQLLKRNAFVGQFPPPTRLWVAPATGFLPSVTPGDTRIMDHVGYRLASLAALPAACAVSRVRLAEAGFHYDPRANAAGCHACGLIYSLEPPGDASSPTPPPMAFHVAQSPQCQLLTSVLARYTDLPPSLHPPSPSHPPAAVAATPSAFPARQVGGSEQTDGRDLSEDGEAGHTTPSNTPSGDRVRRTQPSTGYTLALPGSCTDQSSIPTDPPGSAGRGQDGEGPEDRPQLTLSRAVYPQFSTYQSRLATFSNWPLAHLFPPQMLVMLGFYYAGYADCVRCFYSRLGLKSWNESEDIIGYADCVRCFYCGVGLKSWDEKDDVLQEHIRWRPSCEFLLATKGRQCIQNTLSRIRANNPEPAEEHLPTPQCNTRTQSQVPNTSTTYPRSQASTPGTLPSIGGGQGASGASDANGSPPGGPRGGDLHTDGSAERPRGDCNSQVRQQLVTMGFPLEDITRAQARLRSAGEPDDFEHTLNSLLPE